MHVGNRLWQGAQFKDSTICVTPKTDPDMATTVTQTAVETGLTVYETAPHSKASLKVNRVRETVAT